MLNGNGVGRLLKPGRQIISLPIQRSSSACRPTIAERKNVDRNLLARTVFPFADVESPKDASDVQEDRVVCQVLADTYAASPAIGRMLPRSRVVPLAHETLRQEVMRIGKVVLVQVNCP